MSDEFVDAKDIDPGAMISKMRSELEAMANDNNALHDSVTRYIEDNKNLSARVKALDSQVEMLLGRERSYSEEALRARIRIDTLHDTMDLILDKLKG